MFLPESISGVCYSITVHWARRILFSQKAHFGVTQVNTVWPIELDATQKARMMKKIYTARDLQANLNEYGTYYNFSTLLLNETKKERFKKYDVLVFHPYTEHDQVIDAGATGSSVINKVFSVANATADSIFLVNFRNESGDGHTIGIHRKGAALHFFDSNVGEFNFPVRYRLRAI